MRTRVYVAGPLSGSGDRETNVRNAIQAGLKLISLGYSPLIPHLTHYADPDDTLGHNAWLDVDKSWVAVSDCVLRLHGHSVGADQEVCWAHSWNVPVYKSINELHKFESDTAGEMVTKDTTVVWKRNKPAGHPGFLELLEEIKDLHCKKAADYGTDNDVFANVRASEELGIPAWKGAWLRAKDKVKRIDTYCRKESLANESLEDSLMDLAAYCLIALAIRRENAKREHA